MYNVLLVEDEIKIRQGLKAKLNWEEHGFRVAAEASDGLQAVSQLNKGNVDLMITDIRMPRKDGIYALEQCYIRFPKVKRVVLSGYNDFNYARMAIKYDAVEYLLKPVIRKELISLLQKIRAQLDREQASMHEYERVQSKYLESLQILQEQFLMQLVNEDRHSVSDILEKSKQCRLEHMLCNGAIVQFVSFEFSIPENRLKTAPYRKELFHYAFQKLTREAAESSGLQVVSFADAAIATRIYCIVRIDQLSFDQVKRFIQEVLALHQEYLKVQVTAGLGRPVKSLMELKHGFSTCLLSLRKNQSRTQPQFETVLGSNADEIVAGVQLYLQQHFMEEVSLLQTAELFHVNVTHLSEIFKKISGKTFSDYILELRMVHAEKLLRDPKLTIADIAELTGFSSASYFSTVCKRYFGKSPIDLRSGSRP
ncbi:response regulator [Paenibacillaceae bacterium WGS1546]|uniref:response regulator n=1 Tax=Cohnella sp. WGS1546 TaxID=3366810 RepID=UPI00372D3990